MISPKGSVEIKVRVPKPVNLPSLQKEAEEAAVLLATKSILTPTITVYTRGFNVWKHREQQYGEEWKRMYDEQTTLLDQLRVEKKKAQRQLDANIEQEAMFQLLIEQETERVEKEEREREELLRLQLERENEEHARKEREREEREEREREEREEREWMEQMWASEQREYEFRERLEKEGKWKELAALDGYSKEMLQSMDDEVDWEGQQRHRIAGGFTSAYYQGINYNSLHSARDILKEYHWYDWGYK